MRKRANTQSAPLVQLLTIKKASAVNMCLYYQLLVSEELDWPFSPLFYSLYPPKKVQYDPDVGLQGLPLEGAEEHWHQFDSSTAQRKYSSMSPSTF